MSGNIYLTSKTSGEFLTRGEADKRYATITNLGNYLPLGGGDIQPSANSGSTFRVRTVGGLTRLNVDTTAENGGVGVSGGYFSSNTFESGFQPPLTAGANFHVRPNNAGNYAVYVDGPTGSTTLRNRTDSTNAFRVQNAAGTNLMNVDSTNSLITFNRCVNFQSTVPTVTGNVSTIVGSNMSGQVDVRPTVNITANSVICTVTFGGGTWSSSTTTPIVVITSANQAAGPYHLYSSDVTATSFTLRSHVQIPSGGTYLWNYHVLGN